MGFLSLSSPLPGLASEITDQSGQVSDKINLESVLVSIDDFFNKNPFFVAGVTFVWLIVVPLLEEYFKKYKYISAINAFRKLRDDSSSQLLDIRDEKSLGYLGSPNLRILNKDVAQIPFSEDDEDGFLKRVLKKFADPKNTIVCILDNGRNIVQERFHGGLRNQGWCERQEGLAVGLVLRKKRAAEGGASRSGSKKRKATDQNGEKGKQQRGKG